MPNPSPMTPRTTDIVQTLASLAGTLNELNRAQREFGREVSAWRFVQARWAVDDALVTMSPYLPR
jgi:hypothetical protein